MADVFLFLNRAWKGEREIGSEVLLCDNTQAYTESRESLLPLLQHTILSQRLDKELAIINISHVIFLAECWRFTRYIRGILNNESSHHSSN